MLGCRFTTCRFTTCRFTTAVPGHSSLCWAFLCRSPLYLRDLAHIARMHLWNISRSGLGLRIFGRPLHFGTCAYIRVYMYACVCACARSCGRVPCGGVNTMIAAGCAWIRHLGGPLYSGEQPLPMTLARLVGAALFAAGWCCQTRICHCPVLPVKGQSLPPCQTRRGT